MNLLSLLEHLEYKCLQGSTEQEVSSVVYDYCYDYPSEKTGKDVFEYRPKTDRTALILLLPNAGLTAYPGQFTFIIFDEHAETVAAGIDIYRVPLPGNTHAGLSASLRVGSGRREFKEVFHRYFQTHFRRGNRHRLHYPDFG